MLPTLIHVPPRRALMPWLIGFALLALLYVFRHAVAMGFAAFAIAYVFAPTVRRAQSAGLPRPLAILAVLLVASALVGATTAALVPQVLHQTAGLVRAVPDYSMAVQRNWIPFLRHRLHLHIPPTTEGALSQLGLRASAIAPMLSDTIDYTVTAFEYVFKALIVLALTFYVLLEFDRILAMAYEVVPYRARDRVRAIAAEVDVTLRHFVAGQIVVMVVLGVLYALGLGMLGVPAGWAIGVFAGLISFVPYLGFFVAVGLALLMTALEGRGGPQLLAVVGVMSAVHLLDLTVITPRVLGGRAKLSPIVVILALVAGGSVFGFVGILVAIPVASVLRVLLRELVAYYQTTPFFLTHNPGSALQSMQFTAPDALTSDLSAALFANPPGGVEPIVPPPPASPMRSDEPSEPAREGPAG